MLLLHTIYSFNTGPLNAGVGRDLWRTSCPTLLLKWANHSWWSKAMSRLLFNISKIRVWKIPQPPWQYVPVLSHSHIKNCWGSEGTSCASLCPLPPVLQMRALLCYEHFVSTAKVYHSFYLLFNLISFNLYYKNSYSNILVLPGSIIRLLSTHRANYHYTVWHVKSPQLVIKVLFAPQACTTLYHNGI